MHKYTAYKKLQYRSREVITLCIILLIKCSCQLYNNIVNGISKNKNSSVDFSETNRKSKLSMFSSIIFLSQY